ncbi:hypothetical protein [Umezawaea beigongshangensis]|uniref:hypothetical protein n=1 Tax=Umezawaea beigongshangensis TaxID=2780383 RepID=UPI0018F16197|nr:hypothetical protein [Umezawaea beigongshangensis]
MFLHDLAECFRHFAGPPVTSVVAIGVTTRPGDEVWAGPIARLGADPALGERVRLRPEGLDPAEGVVDLREPSLLGVRTGHGLIRFAVDDLHGMASTIECSCGVAVDRDARTAAWRSWLDRVVGNDGP